MRLRAGRPCKKCADIASRPAAKLVLFEPMHLDRCMTDLWRERMAERVRTEAILMHAREGHE